MSETKRCPTCGAQNAAAAEWCTLCLTRFAPLPPPAPPVVEEQPQPEAAQTEVPPLATEAPVEEPVRETPPAPLAEAPVTFVRDGDRARWVCPSCGTINEIDSGSCRICGTVMARLFAPEEPKAAPLKSAGSTVALSALLPGLGHYLQGERVTAVGRMLLYLWTVGIAILLLARAPVKGRAIVQAVGIAFGTAALGIWLVSVLEGQRLSKGDHRPVVAPRLITWAFTGLTLALFLGVVMAAAAGRSG